MDSITGTGVETLAITGVWTMATATGAQAFMAEGGMAITSNTIRP